MITHFDRHVVHPGSHDLEIVGESNYQEALWRVVGEHSGERVRVDVLAVVATEPDNPHDPSAVSVWIDGHKVGYFCREDALAYQAGLVKLYEKNGAHVALNGVVTGGGLREDGRLGFLGVWLYCTPADFDVEVVVPPAPWTLRGGIRTGLTEAILTDEADDPYDLSWLSSLPSDNIASIARLRDLLKEDPDPIDRHFMYCELEERLYKSRDVFTSALDDYDQACSLHDMEMDGIRESLLAKFGVMPLLDTYRQMAVRQQKAKNWTEALRWSQRGLALYGEDAARPEAVEDLRKRVSAYSGKLTGAPARRTTSGAAGRATAPQVATETLNCENCQTNWEREVTRGRKPRLCPACRV